MQAVAHAADGIRIRREGKGFCMLILEITGMAALLCTVLLYGCITDGKRSDREYRHLWEEYIAVHQKEEEKEKWEDQE